MLRDSAIFGVLLAIMAVGFLQALSVKFTQTTETIHLIRNKSHRYALDAADGETAEVGVIFNSLAQALLGYVPFSARCIRLNLTVTLSA